MNKRRCEVEDCRRLVLTTSLEIRNGGFMCKRCRKEEDRRIEECHREGLQWTPMEMIE